MRFSQKCFNWRRATTLLYSCGRLCTDCLLAERFDFHTNEYWPIAFSTVEGEERSKKKLKDEEAEDEDEDEGREVEEAN
jgi:hypothetical protein